MTAEIREAIQQIEQMCASWNLQDIIDEGRVKEDGKNLFNPENFKIQYPAKSWISLVPW